MIDTVAGQLALLIHNSGIEAHAEKPCHRPLLDDAMILRGTGENQSYYYCFYYLVNI